MISSRIELMIDFLNDLDFGYLMFTLILKFYQKSFEKNDMIIVYRILYI